MASVSPFLVAILIVALIIIIIVVVLVAANQSAYFKKGSTLARQPCTDPPSTPINVSASNTQADIIVLNWSLLVDAESYTAYIGDNPNFSVGLELAHRSTKSNSTSFGNLALGKTYYLKVEAVNACGKSELSNEVQYTLPFQFPDRFVIALKVTPSLEVCDGHSDLISPDDTTAASRFCNFRDAWASYNPGDQSIRQSDRPTHCLTREGPGVNFDVSWLSCTGGSNQKWSYDANINTLCNPSNQIGDCLITTGTSTNTRPVKHGPFTTDDKSDWIFKPV